MFVTIITYRARAGEEDAIIALHEDWQRTQRANAAGFVAGELLHVQDDPRTFIAVSHFEDAEAAHGLASDPNQVAWYRRVASLCEVEPIVTGCRAEWQA